jgi:membrane protein required for colicin V production
MYWLDVLLLVLLGLGAALGFWSGLVMQVARLVSLGLALWATLALNEPVTQLLHERVAPEASLTVLHGVDYVAVFLVAYIALLALSRLAYRLVRATKLALLDRIAGGLLGALKMTLVLAPLCLLLQFLALPATEECMSQSKIAPALAQGVKTAVELLPENYRNQARDSAEQLRDQLQHRAADRAVDLLKIEEALKKS